MAEPEQREEGSASRVIAAPEASRLGGAAADFAAGLGRKVTELRAALDALAEAPERTKGRDELRRKLHALGVGARLLHFEALARAIGEATDRIDDEAARGTVSDALLDDLSSLLVKIPDLAWEKAALTVTPPPAQEQEDLPVVPPPATPWTVLVVGAESLANVIGADASTFSCEVERTDDVEAALDLARTVAPELLVVDVDLEGALGLVEALVEDPLTMPVPIVAVATLQGETSAPKLAALGVTKVVSKPPRATELRSTCAAIVREAQGAQQAALHPDLGELSVAELADRLAEEVRRALVAELDPHSTNVKVSLGVGAEILGPVWGALARVKDVVESRSHGSVVFRGGRKRPGPLAVASALASFEQYETPTSDAPPPLDERRVRPRHPTLELDLQSRIVVVADDDPQVTWFLADVLKGAGAIVLEAKDGGEALALARGSGADAILSDVLMPRVDGLTLARTLQRDVALRDRPIVLLSWKEDLLKRLRDLRMESHAMLRKEADGRTILARVREVLLPRIRIEARIATSGDVRGRLDELSAASLLEITQRLRGEATIVVRDAANVFEVEIEGGGIRSLSRASTDGALSRGIEVLPSLLGVVGGRFLVRAPAKERDDETPKIQGDLNAQLAPVLRKLRAACDAVSGAKTIDVARVELEPSVLATYAKSTPPPVRSLVARIAQGASPRAMLLAGEVAPATLEDVLLDVAARGIVKSATGPKGEDLLAAAERALDLAPRPIIDAAAGTKKPSSPPPSEFDLVMPPSVAPPPPPPSSQTTAQRAEATSHEEGSPASLADALVSSTGERRTSSKPIIDTRELKPRSVPTRSDPPPQNEISKSNAPRVEAISATPTPMPVRVSSPPQEPNVDTLAGVGATKVEAKELPPTMPPPEREPSPHKPILGLTPPPAPTQEALEEARAAKEAEDRGRREREERDRKEREERAKKDELDREQREFEEKLRLRRTRKSEDDVVETPEKQAPKETREIDKRVSERPRVSPKQAAKARKQLRSDAAFWWIILALGVVGASVAFYVQQQEEASKSAPQPAPSVSSSTKP